MVLCALIVAPSLGAPTSASAVAAGPRNYTFYNPNPRFSGTWTDLTEARVGGARTLSLTRREIWSHTLGGGATPRSVVRLASGATLIADEAGRRVVELDASGRITWSFSDEDESSLKGPVSAFPGVSGTVVIADSAGRQVLEVGRDKQVVWSYSSSDDPSLRAPQSARPVPGTNDILISDAGTGRVVQVSRAKTPVWSSGVAQQPRSAARLANGETLIVDEARHRVLAVGSGGGAVAWQFGVDGQKGSGSSHLDSPTAAERLDDGSTLIADSGNGRVLRVAAHGNVLDVYGSGMNGSPESVRADGGIWPTAEGVLMADANSGQITETGYVPSGTYETGDLDLGVPGVNKWVTEILPSIDLPNGTAARVYYSLNGGEWQRAGSGDDFYIEDSRPAGFMRMRVDLSTEDLGISPVIKKLNAAFYLAEPPVYRPKPKPKPGSGSGDTTPSATTSGTPGGSSTGGTGGVALGTGTGAGTGIGGISIGDGAPKSAEVVAVNVTEAEANDLLSGYVLDEKTLSKEPTGGGGGALVDPAGLIAAALILSFAYGMGVSSPITRTAFEAATRPIRRIVLGSLNG
ncbi:MAG: PQQ-binding-like beta-propeller repeat protein [Coriobacteriia bacterium]|nr:PQQ-binding-like beta-propeller repeat protein [Coriobacteriia bacterium]